MGPVFLFFNKLNCSTTGTGTIEDPFIISDIHVRDPESGICFSFSDTESYFILQDSSCIDAELGM